MLNIIEGYEVVGKTSYINSLEGVALPSFAREFGIDSLKGKFGVGFHNSWIVGAVIASLGTKGLLPENVSINLDRGILSTIVYARMQGKKFKAKEYLSQYVKNLVQCGAKITYLYHDDEGIARKMFESSRLERDTSNEDEYDKYENFEDYWESYRLMEEYFTEAIGMLLVAGIKITTVPTSTIYKDKI